MIGSNDDSVSLSILDSDIDSDDDEKSVIVSSSLSGALLRCFLFDPIGVNGMRRLSYLCSYTVIYTKVCNTRTRLSICME